MIAHLFDEHVFSALMLRDGLYFHIMRYDRDYAPESHGIDQYNGADSTELMHSEPDVARQYAVSSAVLTVFEIFPSASCSQLRPI